MGHVGNLFREARKRLGLRSVEVARLAGYSNLPKGIRRLESIEDGSDIFPKPEVYRRFLPVLGLEEEEVLRAMADDFDELDQPVPPRVIAQLNAFIMFPVELPEGVSLPQAIAVARRVAAEKGWTVCVTLSRIRGLYIWPDGKECEGYGLPLTNSPFLLTLQNLYRGKTFKEQLRLFKRASRLAGQQRCQRADQGPTEQRL